MCQYKFTIITVCYNAENFIENTILSLLKQTYIDYEYIIKDGESTDRTLEIAEKLVGKCSNVRIVSQKDQGIYDAMNQALDWAQGEYIYFLNAGDCLHGADTLEKVADLLQKNRNNVDVVYGNIVQISNDKKWIRKYNKLCSKKIYFLTGDCICHQAIFAKKELFLKKKFDTRYKVCADKEWQLYHIQEKVKFKSVSVEVADVLVDGFSKNHISDFEEGTILCVEKYCKGLSWIYLGFAAMKKNEVLVKVLRILERTFFVKN